MKRNPVIPYAIIAVMGILAMIVLSFVGLDRAEEIEQAAQNGGEQQQEGSGEGGGGGSTSAEPEQVFENNCASCHGADLSGGNGPDLTQVGSRLDESEIQDIITNGTEGGMPAFGGRLEEEQISALATWLSEQQ